MTDVGIILDRSGWPIEVIPQTMLSKYHVCRKVKGINDVYSGILFYIAITNLGKVYVDLSKHQKLFKSNMRTSR